MTRAASARQSTFRPKVQLLRISPATRTLSRTESEVNSSRRWKVRARPRLARLCGASLVMSRSSKRTLPSVGESSPVMTLNKVVLPAPFGPISPVMWPGRTAMETASSAVWPPKRMVTSRVSSPATCWLPSFLQRQPLLHVDEVAIGERPVDADELERHLGPLRVEHTGRDVGLGYQHSGGGG